MCLTSMNKMMTEKMARNNMQGCFSRNTISIPGWICGMIVSGVLWLLVICPLRADDAQPLLESLGIYPPVLDLQGVDSTHQLLVMREIMLVPF